MSYTVDFSKYFVGKPNSNDVEIRNVLPCRYIEIFKNDKQVVKYSTTGYIFSETIAANRPDVNYRTGVNDNRVIIIPLDYTQYENSNFTIIGYVNATWVDGYTKRFDIPKNKLYVDIPNRGMKVTSWTVHFMIPMIHILIAYRVKEYNDLITTIEDVKPTDTIRVKATNFSTGYTPIGYNLINTTWENRVSLHLFQNSAENVRVDKIPYLSLEQVLDGVIREECSISQPIVRVEMFDVPTARNYCYIPRFRRWYYITNVNVVRANLFELEMAVDVLMSFKDCIIAQKGLVSRNEYEKNPYVEDNEMLFYKKYYVDISGNTPLVGIGGGLMNEMKIRPSYIVSVANFTPAFFADNLALGFPNMSQGPSSYSYWIDSVGLADFLSKIADPSIISSMQEGFKNRSDFVIGVKAVPFTPKNDEHMIMFCGDHTLDTSRKIYIGMKGLFDFSDGYITLSVGKCHNINGNATYTMGCELDFSFLELSHTYLDYPPYCTIELFLPYIGFINFPLSYVESNYKYVVYKLNSATGDFICYLSKQPPFIISEDTEFITDAVEIFTGNMYVDIGFTKSNISETNLKNVIRFGSTVTSIVGATSKYGASMSRNNKIHRDKRYKKNFRLTKKGESAQSEIKEKLSDDMISIGKETYSGALGDNIPQFSTSLSETTCNNYQAMSVYFRITRMVQNEPKYYGNLIGYPLMSDMFLYEVSGYTVIDEIHLEGFTCTSNELDEIEALLKSGVIF